MAIKNAKTINEYKIRKWIEQIFVPGSVSIEFVSDTSAIITDRDNKTMKVTIVAEEVKVVE